MKIKEKAKAFVTKHKGTIIAGAIGAGVGLGIWVGEKYTYREIEKLTNIDMTKLHAYSTKTMLVKDIFEDGCIPDAVKEAGLTCLEDTAKMAAFIQKQ